MKLFEIKQEILELIDYETGEILDIEKWDNLQMSQESKKINWLMYIKNESAEITALKEQENSFRERRKKKEKALQRSKEQFSYVTDYEPFYSTEAEVSYRKSEAVEVDESLLHKDFFRETVKVEPDKILLKERLKNGELIDGAMLVTRQNIQIK